MTHRKTKTTENGRVFHRSNCQSRVRDSYTNRFGDNITLSGCYAFEWSVGVQKASNKCLFSITTFESREKAIAYYRQLCKM